LAPVFGVGSIAEHTDIVSLPKMDCGHVYWKKR
jgi:hypothetical protein